jgi:phosphoglycolate phosphatase
LLFDLDGTLLDTLTDLADSCNGALKKAGLPELPVEEYKSHVGYGARNMVAAAIASARTSATGVLHCEADLESAFVDNVTMSYRSIYAKSWSLKTVIYEGVLELLPKLRDFGYKLAVLSNKPDDFTRLMVDHYFAEGVFDIVYGLPENWPAKPEPDLALHICDKLGISPEEAALIGDSGSDMETAVRAGMKPLGVLWGFRDAQELFGNGAEKVFASVGELAEYLLADC